MKPVEASEILDLTAYEKIREGYLAQTIAMKKHRRIPLGDRLTFIFENRDTVIFQIQEMTRAERTVAEEAIAEEVAVYNELIPGDHELSATLMIEIPEAGRIRGAGLDVFESESDRRARLPRGGGRSSGSDVRYQAVRGGPHLGGPVRQVSPGR